MKAIVQAGYGLPPDVLALREVEMPRVEANGVLVRVHVGQRARLAHDEGGNIELVRSIGRRPFDLGEPSRPFAGAG